MDLVTTLASSLPLYVLPLVRIHLDLVGLPGPAYCSLHMGIRQLPDPVRPSGCVYP